MLGGGLLWAEQGEDEQYHGELLPYHHQRLQNKTSPLRPHPPTALPPNLLTVTAPKPLAYPDPVQQYKQMPTHPRLSPALAKEASHQQFGRSID